VNATRAVSRELNGAGREAFTSRPARHIMNVDASTSGRRVDSVHIAHTTDNPLVKLVPLPHGPSTLRYQSLVEAGHPAHSRRP